MKQSTRKPKSIVLSAFLSSLFLCFAQSALAQEIGWHDNLTLIPGFGLDPRNPEITHPVVQIDLNNSVSTGGGGSLISASFSQHQFDLVSRLNVNASYAVKSYLGDSGSFHLSFLDDRRYTANTLNFVWEGSRNFGGK